MEKNRMKNKKSGNARRRKTNKENVAEINGLKLKVKLFSNTIRRQKRKIQSLSVQSESDSDQPCNSSSLSDNPFQRLSPCKAPSKAKDEVGSHRPTSAKETSTRSLYSSSKSSCEIYDAIYELCCCPGQECQTWDAISSCIV